MEQLRVASPCAAEWDAMTGNTETRHCSHCNQNVYNLSALTRAQAEELIRSRGARLCTRYLHRADGTMLLRDGAVAYRPTKLIAAGVAALALAGAGLAVTRPQQTARLVREQVALPRLQVMAPPFVAPPPPPARIDREIYVTAGGAMMPEPEPPPPPPPHRAARAR
ncbi:MAG TPA: hypothetical protein VGF94_16150 [Kofleriaceae bacterium]